jgi:hypothetical protein
MKTTTPLLTAAPTIAPVMNINMSYLTRLNLLKEYIIEFYDKEDVHDDNKISDDNNDESSSSITQFYNHILLIYTNKTHNYDIGMELEISFREVLKNKIMIKETTITSIASNFITNMVSDNDNIYILVDIFIFMYIFNVIIHSILHINT